MSNKDSNDNADISPPDIKSIPVKEIESYLKNERKRYEQEKEEPKLLLLGASDSGKSTLLKQLKILHGNGFSDKERDLSRKRILTSVFSSINMLIGMLTNYEARHIPKKYAALSEWFEEWTLAPTNPLTLEIRQLFVSAWKEPEIRELFDSGVNGVPDSLIFFMHHFDRILEKDFKPTDEDILNLRTVTQSVSDTVFNLEDGHKLHVIDVSGLSHHRGAWISYFEDVTAVIFVASLSSYDQTMVEEDGINRMVDSIVLFEDMVNHKLLFKKFFILFLNKKDLYEEKIKKRNIVDFFPNYKVSV